MEVRCICNQAVLVKVDGLQILVDTPLEYVGLLELTPRCLHKADQGNVLKYDTSLYDSLDPETLDVVLVSNTLMVQGLPLLFPKCRARVLMTDPVAKLGKAICEELATLDEDLRASSLDGPKIYSREDAGKAWERVQPVSYHQIIRINEIEIQAVSAGHSLGSANWVITWGDFSLAVVSHSCMDNSRYPTEFDLTIQEADVLLFGPKHSPMTTPFQAQIKRFYEDLLEVCRQNGMQSVIMIPLNPWHFLDLQSRLVSAAAAFHLPIHCISHTTKAFCSCAAGSTEWLNQELKHKAYIPQSAFPYEAAIESKTLRIHEDMSGSFGSEFKEPCLLLVAHSSLRLGEAEYVLSYLANQGKSTHSLLFVDPDFPMEACIAPFRTANWTRRLKLTQSEVKVGLTIQDVQDLVTNAKASFLPNSFRDVLGEKPVFFYSGDDPLPLRKDKPTSYLLKALSNDSGVVFGSLNFTNYAYTTEIVTIASVLKTELETLDISSELEERGEVLIVRTKDGCVELSPRGVTIRARSPDFRKVLLHILKTKRSRLT